MSFNKNQKINTPPNMSKYLVIGGIILFVFLALSNTTFLTIKSGQKGVLFKKFSGGLEKDKVYGQGFHVIAPWNTMFIYDVKTNEDFEEMEVLSKNGLSINIDLSYRYSPVADKIGYLHDEIGTDYNGRIIQPEIRSATREVIGQYNPEELYSTKREAIQQEIFDKTKKSIAEKYIELDAILIRSVALPIKLREAIEQKLEEEQLSLQYQYKIDRERQEAERRIIEAQAKADANKILNASLTDKILRDKGIEATLELAGSPNAKVVVVGGGGDGLPLILNN
jgi:regulator of protease activity HflC (stomatin/prohibitin superfamily)